MEKGRHGKWRCGPSSCLGLAVLYQPAPGWRSTASETSAGSGIWWRETRVLGRGAERLHKFMYARACAAPRPTPAHLHDRVLLREHSGDLAVKVGLQHSKQHRSRRVGACVPACGTPPPFSRHRPGLAGPAAGTGLAGPQRSGSRETHTRCARANTPWWSAIAACDAQHSVPAAPTQVHSWDLGCGRAFLWAVRRLPGQRWAWSFALPLTLYSPSLTLCSPSLTPPVTHHERFVPQLRVCPEDLLHQAGLPHLHRPRRHAVHRLAAGMHARTWQQARRACLPAKMPAPQVQRYSSLRKA